MRITNNMITDKAIVNINGNKVNVDATNTQMTTQKKIDRPSEDPVIAIRSLRLQTSLAKINQYYERNIPDAKSWMEVTETAMLNTRDIFRDVHTLTVKGATGTLTDEDRDTILSQLKQLQKQIYAEGNADYAGRTVFTGFRTDKNLTFMEDDDFTTYTIDEPISATALEMNRYYDHKVKVPFNRGDIYELDADGSSYTTNNQTIEETDYYRMRLSYDDVNVSQISFVVQDDQGKDLVYRCDTTDETSPNGPFKFYNKDGDLQDPDIPENVYIYDNEEEWAKAMEDADGVGHKIVGDPNTGEAEPTSIVVIKSTGEMIFGSTVASRMQTERAEFNVTYDKQGFAKGELRPEYYFNCTRTMDEFEATLDPPDVYDRYEMTYEKKIEQQDDGTGNLVDVEVDDTRFPIYVRDTNHKPIDTPYSIDYTIAQSQTLGVNLEANQIFDHSLYQDMTDMTDAISNAIEAHDKVKKIKDMIQEDQYQDEETQKKLNEWLELANKEMDYYDNNVSKLYSRMIGRVDGYLDDVNLALTKLGCKQDQLTLTEKRMSDQQESVTELKSRNDDMDLSEIIMRYTSAYTAYQSSLTAAGKLGQQTLLNYI